MKSISGRSMVEMLGVLAIVGVLSVGAIAGYQKAMGKYKMNKFSESMNMLVNNYLQISHELPNLTDADTNLAYAELLSKLQLLPDGMKLNDKNNEFITDVFNNRIGVYAHWNFYAILYDFLNRHNSLEICQTLVNIYRENSHELHSVYGDQHSGSNEYSSTTRYYGDKYCTEDKKCLKNLNLDDIYELCTECTQGAINCRFFAVWY